VFAVTAGENENPFAAEGNVWIKKAVHRPPLSLQRPANREELTKMSPLSVCHFMRRDADCKCDYFDHRAGIGVADFDHCPTFSMK
jgi:hypothetical protein